MLEYLNDELYTFVNGAFGALKGGADLLAELL